KGRRRRGPAPSSGTHSRTGPVAPAGSRRGCGAAPSTPRARAAPGSPAGVSPAPATNHVPKQRPTQGEWMVESGRDLPRYRVRVTGDSQLPKRRVEVEEDPLAHHLIALEREDDQHRELDLPARGREAAPRSFVRAAEHAFDDDGLVGVVHPLPRVVEV